MGLHKQELLHFIIKLFDAVEDTNFALLIMLYEFLRKNIALFALNLLVFVHNFIAPILYTGLCVASRVSLCSWSCDCSNYTGYKIIQTLCGCLVPEGL